MERVLLCDVFVGTACILLLNCLEIALSFDCEDLLLHCAFVIVYVVALYLIVNLRILLLVKMVGGS